MGKTTCAAAAAVDLAANGHRVLVISTDPAHSLGDALAVSLSSKPKPVFQARGSLDAVELDADRVLSRWIRDHKSALKIVAARGTYLDSADIERLLELSLPGVDEIVGLVELRRLACSGGYDEIVVDTAPTGHTLRLLSMPETLQRVASIFDEMQSKHRFLAESLGRNSVAGAQLPDPGEALVEEIDREARDILEILRNPDRAAFAWVLLPEPLAVEESRDAVAVLEAGGIGVSRMIVNRLAAARREQCAFCNEKRHSQSIALRDIRAAFGQRDIRFVEDLGSEPRGIAEFRRLRNRLLPRATWPGGFANVVRRNARTAVAGDCDWLNLTAPPGCRLLIFGGKGGVGKTTCAAAAAIAIAEREPKRRILLLSTDPAHSLGDVLGLRLGDEECPAPGLPGLRVREVNAALIFNARRQRYVEILDGFFDSLRGGPLDFAHDRAVARDLIDLSPPGLDEILGMLSVAEALLPREGRLPSYDLVVMDTAPTGHALRLLEMPVLAQAWVRTLLSILLKYRQVMGLGDLAADLLATARELHQFLKLLQDSAQTHLVAVTRPAQLPRMETGRLLQKLKKLKINVPVIVFNAVTQPGCSRCCDAAERERREIRSMRTHVPKIMAAAMPVPPRGVSELRRWGMSWRRLEE